MTIPFELHLHHKDLAHFSEDGRYRYWLKRPLSEGLPWMGVVGCNPSTAGGFRNDQTTRQLCSFAKLWGRGGYELCNVSAGVSTDPKRLASMADPVGPENDFWLQHLADTYDFILLCWGSNADPARARVVARRLWQAMQDKGGTLATLGWTSGTNPQPRHPCRLAHATPLQLLTANEDRDYSWIDPRWTQLIADTSFLDTDLATDRRPRNVG
ncbi:hypothetical protein MTY66_63040 (plasmid) [Mycolicibacterium sp. TY66]|uniref:DUF1643 domain-containing protein n=1 Tax=Mycobacteroides chelonae TaxID=1774 RepID=A0A1S1LP37_MYCCH|nr:MULTISPECIES: DUF1643 domain-containing protein [Mycobacteriaceae]OHU57065.1 hypothetical protein BKG82_12800 [Mycobacteroides chelonae]BCI84679.1 hypothetical protein MTY66_63040 [Mycolicibacterium sp. TY66]BCJ84908.1 hypothetical protein MTY81_62810 [Mycolicibacterium sp. TY81]